MGLRFRKSKNYGPFRINFSKSGVGFSIGGKGFRYTKMANGRTRKTYSLPGTGISYVEESSKKEKTQNINTNSKDNLNALKNDKKIKKDGSHTIKFLKKFIKWTLILFVAMIIIASCTAEEPIAIESITINSEQVINMDVNKDMELTYVISPANGNSDIKVNASSTDIEAECHDGKLTVSTSDIEGSYIISLQSDEVKSNEITINVVDSVKKAEEERRQAELQEQQRQEEIRQQAEQERASQEQNEEYVYVSSSGTKYHSNSSCSNMKNPSRITKDEAISRGFEACKKCY